MISKIIFVFKRYAWFKRLNAKITYELLAKHIPAADWQFMNYGYVPNPDEKPLTFDQEPAQRYPLQMYHYLALKGKLEGKNVLEVGSGRGGGARHLATFFKPASYTGIDIAQNAVDLANKLNALPNLKFIQGSAENIPLADKSIDVVINVESCHGYGSVDNFLKEVKRVLKPGGHLLMVDFRNEENVNQFMTQLKESGLKQMEKEDISENVVRSIEAEDATKRARIEALIPARWQKLFCDFAGVAGSRFHLTLKNKKRFYYRFVFMNS
jgi:ubiquinone/menaquinone biosynthesis C-methylase UbiE